MRVWVCSDCNAFLRATLLDARVPAVDACLNAPNMAEAATVILNNENNSVYVAEPDAEVVVMVVVVVRKGYWKARCNSFSTSCY